MSFLSSVCASPAPLALVALIAYLVGLGSRRGRPVDVSNASPRELSSTEDILRELEAISQEVRRNLANHHASVLRFKDRIGELRATDGVPSWEALSEEAERMLEPTESLSQQIARAYDGIRQRAGLLRVPGELRIDPLTGLLNRRAMEESLNAALAMYSHYGVPLSVAIIDLDFFQAINEQRGRSAGDDVLRQFARLLGDSCRHTDDKVRYGGEEFVVVMPNTELAGAVVFAQGLRHKAEGELPTTISVGLARARAADTPQSLLARADTALYSAKTMGRNCVCRHTGEVIERVEAPAERASHCHSSHHSHVAPVAIGPMSAHRNAGSTT